MKLLLILFTFIIGASAQAQFSKTYSLHKSVNIGTPITMIETSDNGFVFAADRNNDELHFVKLDSDGEISWAKILEGRYISAYHGIIESANGDYFLSATVIDSSYLDLNRKHRVYKLSGEGELYWAKDIQRSADFTNSARIEEIDGHIFVIGSYLDESHSYCMSITKMDLDGELSWQKSYKDSTNNLFPSSSLVTPTGELIIAGKTNKHGFICKLNNSGDVLWYKFLEEGFYFKINEIKLSANNEILMVGTSRESNSCFVTYHVFAARFTLEGNQVWGNHYANSDFSEFGYSINETIDDGLIITASQREYTNSNTWYSQLIKTNASGLIEWSSYLRPDDFSLPLSSVINADGELTILGINGISTNDEDSQYMLTRTSNSFETTCAQSDASYWSEPFETGDFLSLSVEDFMQINDISQNIRETTITSTYLCSTLGTDNTIIENNSNQANVYPNPTLGRINFKSSPLKVVITDLSGRVIVKYKTCNSIDISDLPNGMYLIVQEFENHTLVDRLLKE